MRKRIAGMRIAAAATATAMIVVAAAISFPGAYWRGQRERSGSALQSVYRPAGGFSAGRYPVNKEALQAYLRHQTHGRLAQLSHTKASKVDVGRRDSTLERPVRTRGRRMQRAMESYLTHQPMSVVQKELHGQPLTGGHIKRIHVRSLQHRSKIQEIALRILGDDASKASTGSQAGRGTRELQEPRKSQDGGGRGRGEEREREASREGGRAAARAVGEDADKTKLKRIVKTLQREISLDTSAITAFRRQIKLAEHPGGAGTASTRSQLSQAAVRKLRPQIEALRKRNLQLAHSVAQVASY